MSSANTSKNSDSSGKIVGIIVLLIILGVSGYLLYAYNYSLFPFASSDSLVSDTGKTSNSSSKQSDSSSMPTDSSNKPSDSSSKPTDSSNKPSDQVKPPSNQSVISVKNDLVGKKRVLRSYLKNNFCADITGGSMNNDIPAIMWDCHGQPNQIVTMDANGQLIFSHSNKCLTLLNASSDNFTKVKQFDCNNATHQKWIYDTSDRLRSALDNNKCLTIKDANTNNGAELVLYDCTDNNNQKWKIDMDNKENCKNGICDVKRSQPGWRKCNLCSCIVFDGADTKGKCFASDKHNTTGSKLYSINMENSTVCNTQPGWKWCNKYYNIVYSESGKCYDSLPHNFGGSGNYYICTSNIHNDCGWNWCSKCSCLVNTFNSGNLCYDKNSHEPYLQSTYQVRLT